MTDPSNMQPPPHATNETFKHLLHFTENDLAANRLGLLSKAQQIRFTYQKERDIHTSLAFSFMTLVVIGIVLIPLINEPTGVLACVMLLLVAGAWLFVWHSKISKDLDTLEVLSIKGPIKHEKYHLRRNVYYGIISGNHTFKVSKQLYETFAEGEIYSLYYYTLTMRIIAVEHVLHPSP